MKLTYLKSVGEHIRKSSDHTRTFLRRDFSIYLFLFISFSTVFIYKCSKADNEEY